MFTILKHGTKYLDPIMTLKRLDAAKFVMRQSLEYIVVSKFVLEIAYLQAVLPVLVCLQFLDRQYRWTKMLFFLL